MSESVVVFAVLVVDDVSALLVVSLLYGFGCRGARAAPAIRGRVAQASGSSRCARSRDATASAPDGEPVELIATR